MYFTNNNKEQIYYELRGNISSSKCIVFLNGLSQSTAAWALMTPYFEKEYKILLVDFIFQGQSASAGLLIDATLIFYFKIKIFP
jgi:3-oxoadipate enol-lactonase